MSFEIIPLQSEVNIRNSGITALAPRSRPARRSTMSKKKVYPELQPTTRMRKNFNIQRGTRFYLVRPEAEACIRVRVVDRNGTKVSETSFSSGWFKMGKHKCPHCKGTGVRGLKT